MRLNQKPATEKRNLVKSKNPKKKGIQILKKNNRTQNLRKFPKNYNLRNKFKKNQNKMKRKRKNSKNRNKKLRKFQKNYNLRNKFKKN